MIQQTETFHTLEVRTKPNLVFRRATEDWLRPAEIMAWKGDLLGAIDYAETEWIKRNGNMHGVTFRVVTKSKTITVSAGRIEDATDH